MTDRLTASLDEFPLEARPYDEIVMGIAELALAEPEV